MVPGRTGAPPWGGGGWLGQLANSLEGRGRQPVAGSSGSGRRGACQKARPVAADGTSWDQHARPHAPRTLDSADIFNDDYCVPLYLATTSLRKRNACNPHRPPPLAIFRVSGKGVDVLTMEIEHINTDALMQAAKDVKVSGGWRVLGGG